MSKKQTPKRTSRKPQHKQKRKPDDLVKNKEITLSEEELGGVRGGFAGYKSCFTRIKICA